MVNTKDGAKLIFNAQTKTFIGIARKGSNTYQGLPFKLTSEQRKELLGEGIKAILFVGSNSTVETDVHIEIVRILEREFTGARLYELKFGRTNFGRTKKEVKTLVTTQQLDSILSVVPIQGYTLRAGKNGLELVGKKGYTVKAIPKIMLR